MLQQTYLRDGVAMALNDTYKVDLPKAGKLSALLLWFASDQVSPLGSAAGAWRLADYITRFKMVGDGSEVISDLVPFHAQAQAFYDHGEGILDVLRNYASNTQFMGTVLTFGRRVGDRVLGLDLSKFSNVELQITNTATSSQFSTSIKAYIAMLQFHADLNPPSFAGHLRKELWRQWTTVQDETQYLELPTAHKIRRIMSRCVPHKTSSLEDTTFWNLMDKVEMSVKTKALTVLDMGLDDIARLNAIRYGMAKARAIGGYWTADAAHDLGVGYPLSLQVSPCSYTGAAAAAIPTFTAGDTVATQRQEAYAGDILLSTLVEGLGLHNTAVIYEADEDEPSEYLDPQALATVQLDVHTRNASTAASGTNDIVLERLVA